jgi:outer membrane protein TolC
MKRILLLFLLLPFLCAAQPINLQQVCEAARLHYPMIRQQQLIRQTADLTVNNLGKGYLPQISINGQASYQSDVTRINISFPGVNIEPLSKDQYRIAADLSQVVFDGGVIRQQQSLQLKSAQVDSQKLEVELYHLRERVTQIYLSVLYTDEQIKQVSLIKTDLDNGLKKIQAQVENGAAFKSNLSLIKAERIKAEQRSIELLAVRKGLLDVLSLFMGTPLPENARLEMPAASMLLTDEINRPELQLYQQQNLLISQQTNLLNARNLPKASLFLQGGYGRPGLNMLKNSFETYGIGGLRLNWSLGNLYTVKKEKQIIQLNRQAVDLQKETFLLNTQSQVKQQQAEIRKLQQLINTDKEIISLRNEVKTAATAQLDNGVITPNDYLREVNAEDQARQTMITHQLQLLQAFINLQLITGQIN